VFEKRDSILGMEQFVPLNPKSQMHLLLSHKPFPEQSFGHFSSKQKQIKPVNVRKMNIQFNIGITVTFHFVISFVSFKNEFSCVLSKS
jgi:hypothetical protein